MEGVDHLDITELLVPLEVFCEEIAAVADLRGGND